MDKQTRTVLLTLGIPASGKTTYAKSLVEQGWKRINRDDLRWMLDSYKFSKKNEKFIVDLRNYIIRSLILDGYNIIIDDTNINPQNERDIREIIKLMNNESLESGQKYQYNVEVKLFDIPLEVCIERNFKRENPVPEKVIRIMYKKLKSMI